MRATVNHGHALPRFGQGVRLFAIEHHGHIVTGMTNQIVWGMPHVFAIFLILSASGALNVASMASVFDRQVYKPLARLSGVLAITLLAGGLAVLVLDLGRPDRLIIQITHYNFLSIFTWNIIFYSGFIVIVCAYLWVQMDRSVHPRWVRPVGLVAFVWRLVLTTGTGSIFGWLVARPGYDAAIMAPPTKFNRNLRGASPQIQDLSCFTSRGEEFIHKDTIHLRVIHRIVIACFFDRVHYLGFQYSLNAHEMPRILRRY